jgi:hypothetical protein
MSGNIYAKRAIGLIIGFICLILLLETPIYAQLPEYDQTDSGRVLLNPITVYMVYWLPSGVVADPNNSDFVYDVDSFFANPTVLSPYATGVSGSSYLNILTQYHSQSQSCPPGGCVLANTPGTPTTPGSVRLGGSYIDARPYGIEGLGTKQQPLTDDDITLEITNAIVVNNWKVDNNSIVFVMTGVFASGAL